MNAIYDTDFISMADIKRTIDTLSSLAKVLSSRTPFTAHSALTLLNLKITKTHTMQYKNDIRTINPVDVKKPMAEIMSIDKSTRYEDNNHD
jgi:hypothetical protein